MVVRKPKKVCGSAFLQLMLIVCESGTTHYKGYCNSETTRDLHGEIDLDLLVYIIGYVWPTVLNSLKLFFYKTQRTLLTTLNRCPLTFG